MTLVLAETGAAPILAIAAMVSRYGPLPADYLEFLGRHNGVKPPPNQLDGSADGAYVRQFIAAERILEEADNVAGLSSQLIPIACDDFGNYICIGRSDWKVYFWDHNWLEAKAIAGSFGDLIEKLVPFDEGRVPKPEVLSVTRLDPNFKPEFD